MVRNKHQDEAEELKTYLECVNEAGNRTGNTLEGRKHGYRLLCCSAHTAGPLFSDPPDGPRDGARAVVNVALNEVFIEPSSLPPGDCALESLTSTSGSPMAAFS